MTLRVDHVSYNEMDRQRPILQDIHLEIQDGTLTLLVGQTGAGKSSLIDLLAGLQACSSGAVWYDDQPLWTGKRVNQTVLSQIGVVFQYPEHQLFARTVQGEFDYSLRPLRLEKLEAKTRTLTALDALHLEEQMLSQPPLLLSGGQKRRVALASTFATEPAWLFLDEPTAGLDPQSVRQLTDFLQAWKKRAQGGLVIATHDLDALFPIADRVIVLDNGRVIADQTPEALCADPSGLLQARVGLPSSVQLAQELAACGLVVPHQPLPPSEMAQAILRQMSEQEPRTEQMAGSARTTRSAGNVAKEAKEAQPTKANPTTDLGGIPALPALEQEAPSLMQELDPRTKWAFDLLVSVGILWQSQWIGILLATLITVACVWMSRVSVRYIFKVIRPFFYFIAFSIVLSGIRFGDSSADWHVGVVGFAGSAALATFFQVFKILLIMVLGILLPATTSQLQMKRGLEQALSGLAKVKLPVEAFSLAASLMLRFVPVIMREVDRFSRITRARGKSVAKLGRVRVRDINAIVIPLLLAVLQLGEDLSTAMEARGYQRMGQTRTASIQLQWKPKDWLTIGLGLVLMVLLLAMQKFL